MVHLLLLFSFPSWGSQNRERLSNFGQFKSGGARIQVPDKSGQNLYF